MNQEARAAYLISQAACAMITAMGMQAENQGRRFLSLSPAYAEDAFQKVISDHGIGTNDAIEYWME